MAPQEALNIIEDVTWQDNGRHYGKIAPAREIAISALEKQTPKKPLDIEDTKYKVSYKCPVCKTVHVNEWCGTSWKLPFCSTCGQALDWSDTE